MSMNQKVKKVIKWTAIGVLSTFTVLSLILAIHIYDVTRDKPVPHNANIELGRIDFKASMDSIQAQEIKSQTYRILGVKHVYFNHTDNIMVYGFNSDLTNATQVYDQLKEQIAFEGDLYRVTEEQMASSCPVIDKSSITGRMGKAFESLFASIQ